MILELLHARSSLKKMSRKVTFIDQGRFAFAEFSEARSAHNDGLAVSGGVHIVEVIPTELACRALTFPALDPALQVHIRSSMLQEEHACMYTLLVVCECWDQDHAYGIDGL